MSYLFGLFVLAVLSVAQLQAKMQQCSATVPCQNNGTCVTFHHQSICKCAAGFIGTNCQFADPCASTPNKCQNGGICPNSQKSFGCKCFNGTSGVNCSTAGVSYCASSPCQNGGICRDYYDYDFDPSIGVFSLDADDSGYKCSCAAGYIGNNCQFADPCASTPNKCQNGGICPNSQKSFGCKCYNGTSGVDCSTAGVNYCATSPCQNNGTCQNYYDYDFDPSIGVFSLDTDDSGFKCKCQAGYIGQACQYTNPCFPTNPCPANQPYCRHQIKNGTVSYLCFRRW